jgi:predicted DNA-binding protein (MmcQ/YjbR family)
MMAQSSRRVRKARLTAICLALPDVTCLDKGDHRSFSVGKKVFAYYLHDHHGDQITSVCCKVLPGDNQRLIAANSRKFYMPAYIGPRGWVGLRLDRPTLDWKEVEELILGSYMQVAPPRLLRRMEDADPA